MEKRNEGGEGRGGETGGGGFAREDGASSVERACGRSHAFVHACENTFVPSCAKRVGGGERERETFSTMERRWISWRMVCANGDGGWTEKKVDRDREACELRVLEYFAKIFDSSNLLSVYPYILEIGYVYIMLYAYNNS